MNWVTIDTSLPSTSKTGFSVFAGFGALSNGSRGTTIRVFR